MSMTKRSIWPTLGFLLLLLVVPLGFYFYDNAFYLDLATRLVILGIAATSLNLVLGYGGLISFGHAAYIGIGAYAVGIPVYHEFYGGFDSIASTNGLFQIAIAVGIATLFALITGAISLPSSSIAIASLESAASEPVGANPYR